MKHAILLSTLVFTTLACGGGSNSNQVNEVQQSEVTINSQRLSSDNLPIPGIIIDNTVYSIEELNPSIPEASTTPSVSSKSTNIQTDILSGTNKWTAISASVKNQDDSINDLYDLDMIVNEDGTWRQRIQLVNNGQNVFYSNKSGLSNFQDILSFSYKQKDNQLICKQSMIHNEQVIELDFTLVPQGIQAEYLGKWNANSYNVNGTNQIGSFKYIRFNIDENGYINYYLKLNESDEVVFAVSYAIMKNNTLFIRGAQGKQLKGRVFMQNNNLVIQGIDQDNKSIEIILEPETTDTSFPEPPNAPALNLQ